MDRKLMRKRIYLYFSVIGGGKENGKGGGVSSRIPHVYQCLGALTGGGEGKTWKAVRSPG